MAELTIKGPRRAAVAQNVAIALLLSSINFTAQIEHTDSFEVATVKPSDPALGKRMFPVKGGPGSADPAFISFTNVTLKDLLYYAYRVQSDHISGPEWLTVDRYDVTARVPSGSTKEQLGPMLQDLLRERFSMAVRWDSRMVRGYRLEVAEKGLKLGGPYIRPVSPTGGAKKARQSIDDGYPEQEHTGMIYPFVRGSEGKAIHLMARAQSFTDLAGFISGQLGVPVVDQTGSSEKYNFTLEFEIENMSPGDARPDEQDRLYPLIASALQEQRGLHLMAKQLPQQLLVVERANRVPVQQ